MTRRYHGDEGDGAGTLAPLVPQRAGRRRAVAIIVALAVAWALMVAAARPSAAAPGTLLDISPETESVDVGDTITLTASLRNADGTPATGPGTNTHVRWYFAAGSPNEPPGGGSNHDFECWTGALGACSISYVASAVGTDSICATAGGSPGACAESLGATDWADGADVVQRTISAGPADGVGWSLTSNPEAMTVGEPTTVTLRLTDTDGSGDIGCLRLSVPDFFTVTSVTSTATSAPSPWGATIFGAAPAVARVFNADGNGKLEHGDWVDFTVSVVPLTPGTHGWTGEVVQGGDCTGTTFLPAITRTFSVSLPVGTPTPTPTATPTPSATPTPDPTPTPTPRATPTPSATPTPDPAPTPMPDPTPTPTPTPTPAPTSIPTPTPSATAASSATAAPTPTPAPTPDPVPQATPTPTPNPTPQGTPRPLLAPTPEPNPTSGGAPSPTPSPSPSAGGGPALPTPGPPSTPTERPESAPSAPRIVQQPLSVDSPSLLAPSPAPAPGAPPAPARSSDGSANDDDDGAVAAPAAPVRAMSPVDLVGGVVGGVGGVVGAAVAQVGSVVRPEAVAAVATEFTFPLALALAVLLYLVVQDQIDRRDPKLRIAPQHVTETLVRFESEDDL